MAETPGLDDIDLDRYDFDGLRDDIASILDVQRAVLTTLKWTLLIPLVGSIAAWFVFDARMPRWVLVPYMIVLIAALVLAAINVGFMFVLRNRIGETNEAADRVLRMTSDMHADYLRIQSGQSDLPMKEVATVLTRELIFPALFGAGHNAVAAATTVTGPFGWIAGRLLKYPIQAVETRVLDVLEDPELDDALRPRDTPDGETPERLEGSDITAAMLTPGVPVGGDGELADWYAKAHQIVHRVVDGVGTVATGSLGTILFFALLPLLGWLAFGWFVL